MTAETLYDFHTERMHQRPATPWSRGALYIAASFFGALVGAWGSVLGGGELQGPGQMFAVSIVLTVVGLPLAWVLAWAVPTALAFVQRAAGAGARALLAVVSWWMIVELATFALVGAVLKKTTHNAALTGVTFGVFACLSGAFAALVARKLGARLRAHGPVACLRAAQFGWGLLCVTYIMCTVRLFRSPSEAVLAVALGDAMALIGACIVALVAASSVKSLRISRALGVVGIIATCLTMIAALAFASLDREMAQSVAKSAPLYGWMLGSRSGG